MRRFCGSRRYSSTLDPPTLHQVRIACKRLRYALELFAPQLGAGVSPLRKALVAAQNALGEIQDVTVALNLITQSTRKRTSELRGWMPLRGRSRRSARSGCGVSALSGSR